MTRCRGKRAVLGACFGHLIRVAGRDGTQYNGMTEARDAGQTIHWVHRGGVLSRESHRQLVAWAISCAEHVVHLQVGELEPTLADALKIAHGWVTGKASTGAAIKASRAVHRVARKLSEPIAVSVARSIGQAVAAAHMADHSLVATVYAQQAVARAGKSVEEERDWQLVRIDNILPELGEFIKTVLKQKEKEAKTREQT